MRNSNRNGSNFTNARRILFMENPFGGSEWVSY